MSTGKFGADLPMGLRRLVTRLCTKRPKAVSLHQLYTLGADRAPDQRLRNAQFLHRELPIRIAYRVEELHNLPFDLSKKQPIITVRNWLAEYLERITTHPAPKKHSDDEAFTAVLQEILQDHSSVVQTLSRGVVELKEDLGEQYDVDSTRDQVDAVLNRFYMARIGLRFLISHHIEALTDRPNFRGIIHSSCMPAAIAESAAEDVMLLCSRELGMTPPITVHGMKDCTFTYVPGHIYYMLFELLKNAARAVVMTHGEHVDDEDDLPPVKIVIARGDEDITIKVADEGGGIARQDTGRLFSYTHTTADVPTDILELQPTVRLAGYGVGLPLSRLYAQYFGGNLHLSSMEGFGTDAYLHLNRLGSNCENLPRLVLHSPSGRDSSITMR